MLLDLTLTLIINSEENVKSTVGFSREIKSFINTLFSTTKSILISLSSPHLNMKMWFHCQPNICIWHFLNQDMSWKQIYELKGKAFPRDSSREVMWCDDSDEGLKVLPEMKMIMCQRVWVPQWWDWWVSFCQAQTGTNGKETIQCLSKFDVLPFVSLLNKR